MDTYDRHCPERRGKMRELAPWYEKYLVDVPEGTVGSATVERFEVSKEGAAIENIRAMYGGGRSIRPGTYTRLMVNGSLWMSDTPAELSDHRIMIGRVRSCDGATVLMHGLGLGVTLNAALLAGAAHVTAVEKSSDVLALVGPHWCERWGEDRVELIHDDALTWQPPRGARWDVVWHDIWANICSDNLPEMRRLHRRFGRRAGWQGSWCRHECERGR